MSARGTTKHDGIVGHRQKRLPGETTYRTERQALRDWCERHTEARARGEMSDHWRKHNAERAAKKA